MSSFQYTSSSSKLSWETAYYDWFLPMYKDKSAHTDIELLAGYLLERAISDIKFLDLYVQDLLDHVTELKEELSQLKNRDKAEFESLDDATLEEFNKRVISFLESRNLTL